MPVLAVGGIHVLAVSVSQCYLGVGFKVSSQRHWAPPPWARLVISK